MTSPRHTTAAGDSSIDALPDEECPHCGAENIGRAVSVRPVANHRGMHFECDVCAHAWLPGEPFVFRCELCDEPAGQGNAICPACRESR
jgi:hypothetical protein